MAEGPATRTDVDDGLDPRLGSPGEFVERVQTARDRGMRVVVDLVATTPRTGTPG